MEYGRLKMDQKAVAVGHIPSGLFIVCAKDEKNQKIDGYLASWVQQVSFDPLLVSLSIRPGRPAYQSITDGGIFTINVVGEHDRNFLKHFWKGYDPQLNPFDEIPFRETEKGGIIIEKSKSVMECVLHSKFRPGDHDLVIANVLASYVLEEKAKPWVHIRKTGLDY